MSLIFIFFSKEKVHDLSRTTFLDWLTSLSKSNVKSRILDLSRNSLLTRVNTNYVINHAWVSLWRDWGHMGPESHSHPGRAEYSGIPLTHNIQGFKSTPFTWMCASTSNYRNQSLNLKVVANKVLICWIYDRKYDWWQRADARILLFIFLIRAVISRSFICFLLNIVYSCSIRYLILFRCVKILALAANPLLHRLKSREQVDRSQQPTFIPFFDNVQFITLIWVTVRSIYAGKTLLGLQYPKSLFFSLKLRCFFSTYRSKVAWTLWFSCSDQRTSLNAVLPNMLADHTLGSSGAFKLLYAAFQQTAVKHLSSTNLYTEMWLVFVKSGSGCSIFHWNYFCSKLSVRPY